MCDKARAAACRRARRGEAAFHDNPAACTTPASTPRGPTVGRCPRSGVASRRRMLHRSSSWALCTRLTGLWPWWPPGSEASCRVRSSSKPASRGGRSTTGFSEGGSIESIEACMPPRHPRWRRSRVRRRPCWRAGAVPCSAIGRPPPCGGYARKTTWLSTSCARAAIPVAGPASAGTSSLRSISGMSGGARVCRSRRRHGLSWIWQAFWNHASWHEPSTRLRSRGSSGRPRSQPRSSARRGAVA